METPAAFIGIKARCKRGVWDSVLKPSDMVSSSNSKELTLPFSRLVKVIVELYPENIYLYFLLGVI
jgi:hypothetical protein